MKFFDKHPDEEVLKAIAYKQWGTSVKPDEKAVPQQKLSDKCCLMKM
jgi:hypothetical protein